METCWDSEGIRRRPALRENLIADAAVIGAGLAGLLTAYELQRRGLNVIVLEADRIMSGVSGRTTAKITAQHGLIYSKLYDKVGETAARRYAASNLSAVEKFKRIIDKEKIECAFETVPSYLYATHDRRSLEHEAEAMRKIGVITDVVEETSLPFKTVGALRLDGQAQFDPMKFARAISDKLTIYEKRKVIDIEANRVICENGKVRADNIVMATNYPIINFPGFYFMRQHRERAYVEAIEGVTKLDGIYYGFDGGHSFRNAENAVLVTGEVHRTGDRALKNAEKLRRDVRIDFPCGSVRCTWSTQDCMTHDGIPFIGRYSIHSPNLFVITGFNKWGMTSSMLASEIIADMICDRANDFENLYTPQRLHTVGTKALLADVGQSVKGLGEGLFSKKERKCTHLGCRLKFNEEEQTWDCPCHGSRFKKDGRLINGPAVRDLKK